MRYIIVLIISLFFLPQNIKAQYSEKDENLTTRYRPGIMWFFSGMDPYSSEKLRKYDRLIVNLTYNDWHGDQDAFKSPWNSIGVDVAFMFDIPFTKANTVGMGVGLGYSHYSNRSKLEFSRDISNNSTHISEFDSNNLPKKNLFAANYIEIPLEFRFRSKGYQHFKFMIGAKIGYRINDYAKEVYRIEGKNYKTKHYNFPDSNPLRYGVTARIGIRNWAIFGAYYFSPLFKSSDSVELYPFSLGVSVSLF